MNRKVMFIGGPSNLWQWRLRKLDRYDARRYLGRIVSGRIFAHSEMMLRLGTDGECESSGQLVNSGLPQLFS